MIGQNLSITLEKNIDRHWDLYLLADPSKDMVEKYIRKSFVFKAEIEDQCSGVVVILKNSEKEFEIKNIAVQLEFQNKGIGRALLQHAIDFSKNEGGQFVKIATGNTSYAQLNLYQSIGFKKDKVVKGFFLENYKEEIVEEGQRCEDLIVLLLRLYE